MIGTRYLAGGGFTFPESVDTSATLRWEAYPLRKLRTHSFLLRSSSVFTTTSIVGRSAGFSSQHLWRKSCILTVSPTSLTPCGNSGLVPCSIDKAVMVGGRPPNGAKVVNTSKASIENAKTSADFDSVIEGVVTSMSSGASRPSTACEFAAAANLGLRFMDPSPYLVKRARPTPSMRTLIYETQAQN